MGFKTGDHTKYIKFQPINSQQKDTFDQCQFELDFMEIMLEIVLYVVQFFNDNLYRLLIDELD